MGVLRGEIPRVENNSFFYKLAAALAVILRIQLVCQR